MKEVAALVIEMVDEIRVLIEPPLCLLPLKRFHEGDHFRFSDHRYLLWGKARACDDAPRIVWKDNIVCEFANQKHR